MSVRKYSSFKPICGVHAQRFPSRYNEHRSGVNMSSYLRYVDTIVPGKIARPLKEVTTTKTKQTLQKFPCRSTIKKNCRDKSRPQNKTSSY